MRPGDDHVEAPGVNLQLLGGYAADGVDHDHGAGVFTGNLGQQFNVVDHAGRGVGMLMKHRLGVAVLLQRVLELLRIGGASVGQR